MQNSEKEGIFESKTLSETLEKIKKHLSSIGNSQIAENYKKYLKSPYSFYGIRVPELRKISKNILKSVQNKEDLFNLFDNLWNTGNHEAMSLALFMIQNQKKKLDEEFWFFLTRENILNKLKTWDHVDCLGTGILGFILEKNSSLNNEIKRFSVSPNPWIRRLSIVTQYPNIKKGKIQLTLLLSEKLCYDSDIYVQKGTGWMMREAGKINPNQIQEFIKIHRNMKPAALSYATEKMLPLRKMIKEIKEKEKK